MDQTLSPDGVFVVSTDISMVRRRERMPGARRVSQNEVSTVFIQKPGPQGLELP